MEDNKPTLRQKVDMLRALCRLRDGKEPIDTGAGICWNARTVLKGIGSDANAYEIVASISPQWPKFSGDENYPVQMNFAIAGCLDNCDKFKEANGKWNKETDFGRDRWELLDFLIDVLTKEVGAAVAV